MKPAELAQHGSQPIFKNKPAVVLASDGDIQSLKIRRQWIFIFKTQHLDRNFPMNQFAAQITEKGGNPAKV